MSVDVSPNALARCATHPDELAGAACQRCGTFICAACTTPVLGALYCRECAARPEVNYLETLRLRLWGKRDSSAWFVALCGLMSLLGARAAYVEGDLPTALSLLAAAIVGGCFFAGLRWARYALWLVPALFVIPAVPGLGALAAVVALFPALFVLQIFLDARSKLFFRVDVPERALRRLWDLHLNNPLARQAVALGVFGYFMPLLAPAAIICGFIALRRVDPQARPPIGRRASSVFAIVLGVGATAWWGTLLVNLLASGGLRWLTQ